MVGETLSHYRIISKIGAGGMGEVYLAEDTKLGRKVAIKFLPPEAAADQQARKRLLREARVAATLDHPNICAVYEVGEEVGRSFIVMQYIEGETLAARIGRQPLDVPTSIAIAIQVAGALEEAHTSGLIHRDIKPPNIMLTAREQVKVLDFGLAKPVGHSAMIESEAETASLLTSTGLIVGTLPYMSPEQTRGEELDGRSDLFSFGTMLYEMVAGLQPFAARSAADVVAAILTREVVPLDRQVPGVPSKLAQIVHKCLQKNREHRYQSAGELLGDLNSLQRASYASTPAVVSVSGDKRQLRLGPRRLLAVAAVVMLVITALVYTLYFRRASATSLPEIKSLAVLPLENLSGDPAQEYFADGMTEALIDNLAQIRALNRVISRTSVMRYKGNRNKSLPEIAAELNVDAILEGTVQRAGERVHVTARLIPAIADSPSWRGNYDRAASDVLKLQSDVARAVADEIRVHVTPEEQARLAAARTINREAHDEYLRGREHLRTNEEDLRQAIEHFERAIQLEPDYAAAYAGLSSAWSARGTFGAKTRQEALTLAREAATKAVELQPQSAESHIALGAVKTTDWDWSGAELELNRALELDPNSARAHQEYADLLMALERHVEAIREITRAEQLDPLSSNIQSRFGRVLYRARKYEAALPHVKRAIELDPDTGNAMPYWVLGELYRQMDRHDEAIASFRIYESATKRRRDAQTGIAGVYARQGKSNEARRLLAEVKATADTASFSDAPIARAYALLGDRDEAFKVLFRQVEERNNVATYVKSDPPFESLHSDRRWKELLRRMNLEP